MDHGMRILVANEPRAYREALAAVVQALRPQAEVVTAEPAALDGAVAHVAPDLVVCSRLTPNVRALAPAWVLLYPDGQSGAVVSVSRQETAVAGIDLDRILAAVDQAARLARSR